MRPILFQSTIPGVYSLDFHFGSKEIVAANNVAIKENGECQIPDKPPFECDITKASETFEISLYEEKNELVAQGTSRLFPDFSEIQIENGTNFHSSAQALYGIILFVIGL